MIVAPDCIGRHATFQPLRVEANLLYELGGTETLPLQDTANLRLTSPYYCRHLCLRDPMLTKDSGRAKDASLKVHCDQLKDSSV
jgi:hypothetical protein